MSFASVKDKNFEDAKFSMVKLFGHIILKPFDEQKPAVVMELKNILNIK